MQKVLLSLALLMSSGASAQAAGPILVKTSATGFVRPEWTRVETCELYQDKVVISRRFGQAHVITETKPLHIEGSLSELAEKAAHEPLKEEPGMICDLPTTRVYAVISLPQNATAQVPLFATGACGSPSQLREGGVTKLLRDMIDVYCPTTHEIHE